VKEEDSIYEVQEGSIEVIQAQEDASLEENVGSRDGN